MSRLEAGDEQCTQGTRGKAWRQHAAIHEADHSLAMGSALTDRMNIRAIEAFQKTGRKGQPTFNFRVASRRHYHPVGMTSIRDAQYIMIRPLAPDSNVAVQVLLICSPESSELQFSHCTSFNHDDAQHTNTTSSARTCKCFTYSPSAGGHRSHLTIRASPVRLRAILRWNLRDCCAQPHHQSDHIGQTKRVRPPRRLR